MNRKHIVLFDMDGTLTPPREPLDRKLLQPLRDLSLHADIGILTGSDIDYLKFQMKYLIKYSELRYKTHLLPCNGTKHYTPPTESDEKHKLIHNVDMNQHLGDESFRQLMMILCSHQEMLCYNNKIPLTGNFISYRGSMINWCPIGRNANKQQRQQFIEFDKSTNIAFRTRELDKIKYKMSLRSTSKVDIKLGGETSFDIYPAGWDKTYALKHFSNYTCWFVGDRCGIDGNDKEIYEFLKNKNRSFWTHSTNQTASIIQNIIEIISDDS